MAEQQLKILRRYELRLLRCAVAPPASDSHLQPQPSDDQTTPPSPLHSHINDLVTSIECGDYLLALSSDAARLVFHPLGLDDLFDSAESADRVYSELLDRVEAFIGNGAAAVDGDMDARVVFVMCLAVAALLWFTQCNMTGPLVEKLPKCSFPLKVSDLKGGESVEWENWARNQLMSSGSDLLGKFSYLQYIVFAKMLLMKIKDMIFEATTVSSVYEIRSVSWWLTTVLLVHQRILDERSSSLFDLLHVYMGETLNHFGTLEKVTSYWGSQLYDIEPSDIVSGVYLEAGVLEYIYGRVDSCRRHFESAEVAAGLQLSVTGALGFRTVHQVDPKAQMVLVANTSSSNTGDVGLSVNQGIQTNSSSSSDVSEVLMIPKLLENGNESETGVLCIQNAGPVAHLKAIQQAVILSKCLLIEKSTRHDEMLRWDMAPYLEATDSQQSSYFILQSFCDVLRIRWESTRSRTKGRALEMMDKLVEGVQKSSPGVAQRIPFCYVVNFPTVPALRKEYAELLVSCGLIGEAIKIFEDLELWDNLIHCNCLLGKKAAAVELIKARLSEMPNDPRLWCSLGDVTNNDACYEKALEVSNDKSARAKRSLARSAYNRGDYDTSKILWDSAMALNSLYPDGWFALGAAALKARDVEKALDGFTRAVQLDPENGEAWNNIACLYGLLSFIRSYNHLCLEFPARLLLSHFSLQAYDQEEEQRVFHRIQGGPEVQVLSRNNWQLWENYSQVAFDVGNISQPPLNVLLHVENLLRTAETLSGFIEDHDGHNMALEALQMVLNLTKNKRIDAELLKRIMLDLEGRVSPRHSESSASTNNHDRAKQAVPADSPVESVNGSAHEESTMGRSRPEHLMELLGKILQQIVRSESRSDVWGLYARWHRIKGDLTMCCEALLKQVRSYQGSDLWKDRERFKKFAHASLELSKVYMEISSSTGSHRELFAAEMHLKNTIKQARHLYFSFAERFSDMEEFKNLQACLDEVKTKLQSDSVPT
ncbi:hypothetical protein JRO89_XS11G0041400 [Xanthoceras sorbifolium]|uniref:Tetratricopeptide repeat protein 27 homolog n=1 Tax=Xanthoceras sorbifolium TaxID=99658 RepID=A0ABQ8HEN3_9ROSI|nr:hypothetical protein JRO89_XS11G0041400 [Xanthoceras sorbifolium]